MDTFGAVLGPLFALLYLYFYPEDYITLFYIAFIPGLLAVISSFLLKEKRKKILQKKQTTSFFSFINYWKTSPVLYKKVVLGLLAFTLFNSSDVFLLLKAKEAGLNDTATIGVYIFYNLIYALFALPLGVIADKIGLKNMLLIGLSVFAIVYFGMSVSTHIYTITGLFFLYGIYAAATEGISKAWISNITNPKDTATAIGTFSGYQSICTMIASSFAGLIWYNFGANTVFFVTGIATSLIIGYFLVFVKSK
jgi:MFS family permease